ncbi:sensor domain-containing diguanylate cyclase [Achromobacter sp.]|uniref:GGDEF domain-containing protein n=1 Tax=Achromobacter sp. TaxID=134375 RepID=UPI0028AE3A0B|nr:sensor domain-containing diguanylate cyclase [Achromobacter sp.]
MARERKVRLLTVLISLAVFSVAVGFFNAMVAGYQAQKTQVVKNTLESNLAYAQKLADIINLYIRAADRQLLASADRIVAAAQARDALNGELSAVTARIEGVTAVLYADGNGNVTGQSSGGPEPLAAIEKLSDLGVRELRAGQWVSPCCLLGAGLSTLTLVEPIAGKQGAPAGYLAAVVVLERGSGLDRLIGQHAYADGTSIYLVNVAGQMLYRHSASGAQADVVSSVKANLSLASGPGAAQVLGSSGEPVLAGYVPLAKGNWAVVVERPLDQALSPLKDLLGESLRFAIPAVALTLLLVCACAYAIARPLTRLTGALASPRAAGAQALKATTLKTWYDEAEKLRQALAATLAQHRDEVGRLNTESMTDPMTGLLNRRALHERIDGLVAAGDPFAVIALDLDHFKQVNDVHGHPTGDKVLVTLTKTLQDCVRADDKPFRIGGEEFVVMVPAATSERAVQTAERIRAAVAARPMPDGVGAVTVSVGVALWPRDGESPQAVVKCADQALYASKQAGRNRVTLWNGGAGA